MHIPNQVSYLVGVALVLLIVPNGYGDDPPPKAFETATRAMQHLLSAAKVDTDAGFKTQFVRSGQRNDHRAPAALRSMLRGEEIVGGNVTQGVVNEDGRVALYWRIRSGHLSGVASDVQQRLVGRLDGLGFQVIESPEKRYQRAHRRQLPGAEESVFMTRPVALDGARMPVTQLEFLWTVRATATAPLLTYSEVKHVLPMLHDKRIDELIYSMFQGEQLVRVECGGKWLKYCRLRVDVHDDNDGTFHQQILSRLEKARFTQKDRPRFSTWDVFQRGDSPRSRPIISLQVPKDTASVWITIDSE